MGNGIRTIYSLELNKEFISRFFVGSQVRRSTSGRGRKTYRSEQWMYNEEDICSNILHNVFTQPLCYGQDVTQDHFKQSPAGSNWEFSFF